MKRLKGHVIELVVYELVITEEIFYNLKVIEDPEGVKSMSDVIVSNRFSDELLDVQEKVYTRDLFNRD